MNYGRFATGILNIGDTATPNGKKSSLMTLGEKDAGKSLVNWCGFRALSQEMPSLKVESTDFDRALSKLIQSPRVQRDNQ
jgi:hypothetical protein